MPFPVTALYAALLALLLITISWRVSKHRKRAHVSLGDGGDELLIRAGRAQANFTEYVPLALILMLLLEAAGLWLLVLHGLGVMLLVGRLAHSWGMMNPDAKPSGRWWGTALTWVMLLLAALLNLWLLPG